MDRPMFWQPFRHDVCGCYLEWGMEVPDSGTASATWADLHMQEWLRTVRRFPCPQHGSATGNPEPPLNGDVPRHLKANGVWYRSMRESRKKYADRIADYLAV